MRRQRLRALSTSINRQAPSVLEHSATAVVQEKDMSTSSALLSSTLAFALCVSADASPQGQYTFTDLGDLGVGGTIEPQAINNAGTAVGRVPFGSGQRPFIWTSSQGMIVLPGVNLFATPLGINDDGDVVGFTGVFPREAFRWSNGALDSLGFLPGDTGSRATAILGDGTVVGNSGDDFGSTALANTDVFIDSGGGLQLAIAGASVFGASPNGMLTGDRDNEAFLRAGGQLIELGIPGGFDRSAGADVNDSGLVVGRSFSLSGFSTPGSSQAYTWSAGAPSVIPVADSEGVAVNAHGLVLGNSDSLGPFLFDANTGAVVALNSIQSIPGGAQITAVTDINDRGQILGQYRLGPQALQRAFILDPTPISQSFCVATPNSLGQTASIAATGSRSVAANQVILQAQGVPNGAGIFFFGTQSAQVPLGNGNRCVGGSLTRLGPVVNTTGNVATLRFDVQSSGILAGQTRFFQLWYRDAAAGGAFFNLTDGASIDFVQ